MGLQSAGGHLEKAVRQLTSAWEQAKENWKDEKMVAFEDRYVATFQHDTRRAIELMTRMAATIERIRRECAGGEFI